MQIPKTDPNLLRDFFLPSNYPRFISQCQLVSEKILEESPLNCLFIYVPCLLCTIASKINGTPKGVYLPISKLHSSLAVMNLLGHNNISQICYCCQISLQSAAVNSRFSDNMIPFGVTFILLAMVPIYQRKFCSG